MGLPTSTTTNPITPPSLRGLGGITPKQAPRKKEKKVI